ncbi:periplasmic chaperone for outer membrane proteins SurA [Lutibacter agarilyticus]|uniref:Periplasmic chaperone for outer membrane proteins SurA n=2 Tax=Lutibacter agarilyticus TaxID=1109740 RepID=A0A238WWE5_9FLAO|nr:periplasmic chaperone for outer membrane proteins SurA [Lutibacter agarilyticus]
MQIKNNNLKYINMKYSTLLAFLFILSGVTAQERIKVDGVAVVIGDNIVLDSDLGKFKKELQQRLEGKALEITDCGILEEIMLQKLIAHHAVIDSVEISEGEINEEVDRNIAYFTQQLGSMDKVVSMYGFNDEEDLRKELYGIQREQILIRKESASITESIDVTPDEVRTYFKNLEVDNNLPEFSAEIELAQIVKVLKPSEEEIERVLAKLNEIKEDVEEGFSFRLKAIINSDDPAVSSNGPGAGGKYTITRQSGFIKEFKEVAFSLDEGQISEPFESGFGYHIIIVDKIKGQERDVSHILIQPQISNEERVAAEDELNKLRERIINGEITFEDAAKEFSDDKETRMNRGLLLNPQTNDTKFDLTRMDPQLYNRVSNIKTGEITAAFYEEVRGEDKMFKIIKVNEKVDAHTAHFSQDYEKIQQLALEKKKEEVVEKWAKDKLEDTYIKINKDYVKCDFQKNWNKF